MTTIINPETNNNDSNGGGMGFLIGMILLVIFGVLFFVYGLPMIQNVMREGVQVNVRPETDTIKLDVEEPEVPQESTY